LQKSISERNLCFLTFVGAKLAVPYF
jgi:hypothetical protein